MPRQENIDTLKRATDQFKARDLDGHLQMYSASVLHHGFSNRIRPGVPGLKDHYTQMLQGFPDMRVDIDDIIADGEKVAHRFTFYGTHKGEYMGYAPSMKIVSVSGVQIHLFQSGKCVEVWQVLDTLRFLSQIGALPPTTQTR